MITNKEKGVPAHNYRDLYKHKGEKKTGRLLKYIQFLWARASKAQSKGSVLNDCHYILT